MRAAIVAVGSELLGTDRLDTNSLRLTEALERHGVELRRKLVVGDDEAELAAELERLLGEHELVLVTGGLGPTADDVTRAAAARALGCEMVEDPEIWRQIADRFELMGLRLPEVNRRQAQVIDGAEVLANQRGTAPGLCLARDGATLFLFPGVPSELEGMIDEHLEPWLAARSGGASRESAVLKVAGLPESTLEERIAPFYGEFGREAVIVLAKPGEIQLRVQAAGSARQRHRALAAMKQRLRELVGEAVYAEGAEATLEGTVGELLRAEGRTLVTAESCTGGLLAERITRVPGSSDYFLGGAVAYFNELKVRLLGVPEELMIAHGAVSEPVARAMAAGARSRFGADFALAVTGIAGPGGGSAEKPVGTVHIALDGPSPADAAHRRICYPGDRRRVRWLATQVALEMLRRRLLRAAGVEG